MGLKNLFYAQKSLLRIDYYARFINFNYTTFLESLYGIERKRINYIHGHRTDPLGSLVIGHGISDMDLFDHWYRKVKPRYDKVYTNKKGRKYKKRDLLYHAYFDDKFYHPAVEFAVEARTKLQYKRSFSIVLRLIFA